MIGICRVLLGDITSIFEAKIRVRVLARDLGFDPLAATRLASLASELAGEIYQQDEEATVDIGLDDRKGRAGLALCLQTRRKGFDTNRARSYFDDLGSARTRGGVLHHRGV